MTGITQAEGYDNFIRCIPDPRYTFMNFGYYSDDDSFGWMRKEDMKQKYSMNLIHFMLDGVELTGKKVLEVGCGRGGNCSYVASYTDAREIVGLDYTMGAIEFCRKVHRFDNISFHQGDAQALPFGDGEFDVVINVESSHSYTDLHEFIREVDRVLVKGGIFSYADAIFSQKMQKEYEISEDEFEFVNWKFRKRLDIHERVLKETGFRIVKNVDISRQVTRSLEQEEGNFQNYVKEMLDPSVKGNHGFIDRLIHNTGIILDAFQRGDHTYMYWLSEKPA